MKTQNTQYPQKQKPSTSLLVLVISFILLFVLCAIGMLSGIDWKEIKENPSAYSTYETADT